MQGEPPSADLTGLIFDLSVTLHTPQPRHKARAADRLVPHEILNGTISANDIHRLCRLRMMGV